LIARAAILLGSSSKPVRTIQITGGVLIIGTVLGARPAPARSVAEPTTRTVTSYLGASMGLHDPANNDSLGNGAAVAYDLTSKLGFEGELNSLGGGSWKLGVDTIAG
jgi:hypothetical protein